MVLIDQRAQRHLVRGGDIVERLILANAMRAWQMRGIVDRLCGGVGMRRGRRDPEDLRVGDTLDFWRVETVEKNRLMRLRAEMKVPGKAWLQFESSPVDGEKDKTLFTVTAYLAPYGFFGFLYWYAMWPFHKFIFDGLTRRIAERAQTLAASPKDG